MRILRMGLVVALSLVGFQAQALTIDADSVTCNAYGATGLDCWEGPSGSPADQPTEESLAAILGWTDTLTEQYKAEVGGSDGLNYDTVFANSANDPEDATITYTGPDAMDCVDYGCFLLVKDGSSAPNWYLFDLSSYSDFAWNGTDTIYLTDFWGVTEDNPKGNGAISNVALFSGEGKDDQGCLPGDPNCGPTDVPEPSSLILLGLGLAGLGLRKRMS